MLDEVRLGFSRGVRGIILSSQVSTVKVRLMGTDEDVRMNVSNSRHRYTYTLLL